MERVFERSRTDFISKVMNHMGIGLLLTFAVAYWTSTSEAMQSFVYGSGSMVFILMLAEVGLVIFLSRRINHMSFAAARTGFYVYAALNGLTLSAIFMMYTPSTIYTAFISAAVVFLAAGFIGVTIKKDLTGFGQFLFMMLIGVIVASVINFFMRSDAMSYMISLLGVFIFSGLTVYDMQKIKNIHYNVYNLDGEAAAKYSILGALTLYLDFINLFIYILRLLGRKR